MKKENVIVLAKKIIGEGTRTHLLYLKGNPTPFVVCSNYQEDNTNTTVSWDWGHYHKNILNAIFTMYEDELQKFYVDDLEILTKDELNHIIDFYTKDSDEFTPKDVLTPKYKFKLYLEVDRISFESKKCNIFFNLYIVNKKLVLYFSIE